MPAILHKYVPLHCYCSLYIDTDDANNTAQLHKLSWPLTNQPLSLQIKYMTKIDTGM